MSEYTDEEMSKEELEKRELLNRVNNLERIVECLCATNFLLEQDTVDEEYRGHAVNYVNRKAKRASDFYIANKSHGELWQKKRDIELQMQTIEQDYPQLRNSIGF